MLECEPSDVSLLLRLSFLGTSLDNRRASPLAPRSSLDRRDPTLSLSRTPSTEDRCRGLGSSPFDVVVTRDCVERLSSLPFFPRLNLDNLLRGEFEGTVSSVDILDGAYSKCLDLYFSTIVNDVVYCLGMLARTMTSIRAMGPEKKLPDQA